MRWVWATTAVAALSAPWQARFTVETPGQGHASFVLEVHPEWAPIGAARFQELVDQHVYTDAEIFRVVPGFVAQWGIPADPDEASKWRKKPIADDPSQQEVSNLRGYLSFAKSSKPNSRTSQVFINLADNAKLDSMGFVPVGRVVEGMAAVDSINSEYGESPQQQRIQEEGNGYLTGNFPRLTRILSVENLGPAPVRGAGEEPAERLPHRGCQLIPGVVGIMVQGLLFVCVCLTLIYKRSRDPPPMRPWSVFLLDSSKQLVGGAFIHLMNLAFAEELQEHFLVEGTDACNWYWINIVVDCTLGVGVAYFYLQVIVTGVVPHLCPLNAHEYQTGDYRSEHSTRPDMSRYRKQIGLWLVVVFCMKVTMVALMAAFATMWLSLSSLALAPVEGSSTVKLVTVMIVTPTVFNAIQFWLQDNFLRKEHADEIQMTAAEPKE